MGNMAIIIEDIFNDNANVKVPFDDRKLHTSQYR